MRIMYMTQKMSLQSLLILHDEYATCLMGVLTNSVRLYYATCLKSVLTNSVRL